MTIACKKIITDEKKLKELQKKTFGERHVIMQKRASTCQIESRRKLK